MVLVTISCSPTTGEPLAPAAHLGDGMDKHIMTMASQFERMRPTNVEQETYCNFAFGALHALARSEELGYRHHNRQQGKSTRRATAVGKIAARMAKRGVTAGRGEWLAGYYYNDALFRMDIAYEHILRHRTGLKNAKAPKLLKKAVASGLPRRLLDPSWTRVHDEVNDLKHCSWEFGEGPGIEPDEAVEILRDLIKTVEWALKHGPRHQNSPS